MDKYRIEVCQPFVEVWKLKEASNPGNIENWDFVGEYKNIETAFHTNENLKSTDFRITRDRFSSVRLENF